MAVARYRVDIAGLVGGPGLSTFHFDTAVGGFSPQNAVDAVEAMFNGLDAITSNDVTWTGEPTMDTIDLTSGQVTGQAAVTPFTVVGLDSAEVMAPTTQGLIKWLTGSYVNGRQLQGKTFLPCPTIDVSQDPGVPVSGYVTGGQAQAQLLIDADVGFSVYSRTHAALRLVESCAIWPKWAVLRGRRDG